MEFVSSQTEVKKCGHFSIRGYVSEVRKKDPKLCWPFSTKERIEALPALLVPNFRYWKCENLVKNAVIDNVEISNPCNSALKPCVTSSLAIVHVPSEGDASMCISGFQQASREKTFERKPADVGATVYLNEAENKTSLTIDVQDGCQQAPREKTYERKNDDASASVYLTHVENNTPCIDLQNGSQQGPKEKTFDGKTADARATVSVNVIGNSTSLSVDVQGKEVEVRNEAYQSRDDDVAAAVRNNPSETYKIDGAQDTCPSEDHEDGTVKNAKEAISDSMGAKRKLKCIKDSKSEKPRGFRRNNLTKAGKQSKKGASDSVVRGNSAGPSKKKKRRRSLTNIYESTPNVSEQDYVSNGEGIVDLVETDSEYSSSESDASLGIDLNLSPREDEDEGMSVQQDVPNRVEDVAVGDQHTAIVNDQMPSLMKDGKMPLHEDIDSFLMTSPDDTSRGVQTTNENVQVQLTGVESISFKPAKDASIGRGLHSEIETTMAGPSNGGEILRNKNKSLNSQVLDGKLPLMPPKRGSMPQMETGGSSLGHQSKNRTVPRWANIPKQQFDQRATEISEQADSDDIPMDIVELMAKNQHERLLGASGNSNYMSGTMTNKVTDFNQMDKTESRGNEMLRFLQEKKLQKRRTQPSNERRSAEAKRLGSLNPIQSVGYISEIGSRPNRVRSLPEQSHASKGFTNFSQNQEKPLSGAQLFLGSSSRNCDLFSQNLEKPSSGAQLFIGSSSKNCGSQNPAFSQNQENPSGGAQFFLGGSTSSRDYGYPNSTFSKYQERSSSGAPFFFGGSTPNRNCGNLNSTFLQNHEKPAIRAQFPLDRSSRNCVDQNSYWDGKLVGHTDSQPCLQTSEAYLPSQSVPWQNSFRGDRHAWSPIMPNRLPFGINNPPKFAVESNNTNERSQCLELFPKGNMNGDNSVKYMDPFANHLEKKKSILGLETTKRTHPEYPFAFRERGIQFNPQSVRPVDLYNNGKIPATQLLRLMDAGVCPSKPINVDENENENEKFTSQPSLPRVHHPWGMSRFGHLKNIEAVVLPPPSKCLDRNRNHRSRKFGGNFPPAPEVGSSALEGTVSSSAPSVPEVNKVVSPAPSLAIVETVDSSVSSVPRVSTAVSSLQKNDIAKEDPGSRGSYPAKSAKSPRNQMKGKAKTKEAPTQSERSRSNKAVSGNGTSGKNNELVPIGPPQKGFTTESMPSPTLSLAIKDPTKCGELEVNKAGTVGLGKRGRMTEFCYMSRNPAEFTLPELGNEYMIGYADLKKKENVLSRDRTGLMEPVRNKRQKMAKLADM